MDPVDEVAEPLAAKRQLKDQRKAARTVERLAARRTAKEASRPPQPEPPTPPPRPVPPATAAQPGIVEVNQPMLLITQVIRSGGMLLSRLFDAHPQCWTYPRALGWDPDGGWPSFDVAPALGPAQAFGLVQDEWIRRLGVRGYSYKYSAARHRSGPDKLPYPFVFDRRLAFELFGNRYRQRQPDERQRPLLDAYLTAFFNAWLDYQGLYTGPKRWVTALLAPLISRPRGAERFFTDYPDGHVIAIVRHPAPWVSGVLADNPALEETMAPWEASTRGILDAAQRYGDRVIVVRFDDLVQRTEATMRTLCIRVGITYDPVLLKPTFNSLVLTDTVAAHDKWRRSTGARNWGDALGTEVWERLERTALPTFEEACRLALVPHV